MEQINESQSVTKGKPKAVNVQAIERELTRLWKSAAEAADEKGQLAVMRACSLNLVVYLPSYRWTENINDQMAQVILQHPSRAIVMIADDEATESSLEAWISAHCKLPTPAAAGKQVCCEQVMLRATGEAISEIPSTVVSLLVPDLPVFLWWRGAPPFEAELFDRLVATADRVIIDSADFENPMADLSRLANLITSRYSSAAFSDLAWARLTPWRQLAAQFFDSPAFRPYLYRLSRVIIEYRSDSRSPRVIPPEALLVAGWLASRLEWQLAAVRHTLLSPRDQLEPSSHVLNMLSDARAITIELRAATSSTTLAGGLVSLKLGAEVDQPALFSISQTEDSTCIETSAEVAGMNPVRRIVHREDESLAQMVSKELEIIGHDVVYEQTLKMAGTFA